MYGPYRSAVHGFNRPLNTHLRLQNGIRAYFEATAHIGNVVWLWLTFWPQREGESVNVCVSVVLPTTACVWTQKMNVHTDFVCRLSRPWADHFE